ncbi:MAG: SGNH/GDSL hydrolase family protein [Jatrophihabitans sp.]
MSRAARARRVAKVAAFGSGSVGAVGAAAAGLIYGETKLARRRIKPAETPPPDGSGRWLATGASESAEPLHTVALGDSSAAGYGTAQSSETPAALLAIGLSAASGRPVVVRSLAVVGAESRDLLDQVDTALADPNGQPRLALIMIGANDVTHRVRPATAVRYLATAVRKLREAGCEVVVGTCPDLGTIRPIAQPLRYIARRISRNLAAAQTVAVVEAGGRTVSLGDILGPQFAAQREMFSADAFHPSAAGYAAAVEVMLPSAAAALGLDTTTEPAGPFLTRRARPVAKAAARAASHPGTEVSPTELHGEERGRRGRWARMLRRSPSDDPSTELAGTLSATPVEGVHSHD